MKALRLFIFLTLLTGVLYPLVITGIAQTFLKTKASGSFIASNGAVIGSELIAQKFISDQYFWSRPSAIDYNPLPSGGSNLGPTSSKLKKLVIERKAKMPGAPSDLLFASGSGLDPHITLQAAYFQMERVAKARGIEHERLKQLIDDQLIKKSFGFLGEERLNVLLLNKALTEIK